MSSRVACFAPCQTRSRRRRARFRDRGGDISRVEGFSDCAFGFAVTLLVVSLEVPKTFDGLVAGSCAGARPPPDARLCPAGPLSAMFGRIQWRAAAGSGWPQPRGVDADAPTRGS